MGHIKRVISCLFIKWGALEELCMECVYIISYVAESGGENVGGDIETVLATVA